MEGKPDLKLKRRYTRAFIFLILVTFGSIGMTLFYLSSDNPHMAPWVIPAQAGISIFACYASIRSILQFIKFKDNNWVVEYEDGERPVN